MFDYCYMQPLVLFHIIKSKKRKIKVESAGKISLELSEGPPPEGEYILSSSDEDLPKEKKNKGPITGSLTHEGSLLNNGCLIDSSDDEDITKKELYEDITDLDNEVEEQEENAIDNLEANTTVISEAYTAAASAEGASRILNAGKLQLALHK